MSPSSSPLPSAPLFVSYPRLHTGAFQDGTLVPTADWALEAPKWESRGLRVTQAPPLLPRLEQRHARGSVGCIRGRRQPLVRRSGQYFTEHPRSPELATAAKRE